MVFSSKSFLREKVTTLVCLFHYIGSCFVVSCMLAQGWLCVWEKGDLGVKVFNTLSLNGLYRALFS